MSINILLREGIGMFLNITIWEWEGNRNMVMGVGGNGIKKVIPTHL